MTKCWGLNNSITHFEQDEEHATLTMSENRSPIATSYTDPIMQVLVLLKDMSADIEYIRPVSG
jgi:hypothetical protein